jgi:GAF domain-containing protein
LFENLVAVARATTEQPTLKETLQNTLDVAAILTDAESGSLILLDENGIVTHQIQALERRTSAQDPAFLQQVMTPGLGDWVVSQRQATIIADVALDQRWLPLTDKDQTPTRSVLAVLIVTGTILLGVLTLTHSAPGHFKADQLHLMQAAADQMALAIRNAQIFEAQRRLADRQITLNEILRTVAAQTQPEQVIRVAVKMINQFAGWSNVIIALPNKEETYWTAHSVTGTLTGLASLIFPMKPGLIGDAFKKVQTQLKWGASIDPRIDGQAPANCWALAVPMRRGAQILGVLGLEGPPSTTFDNDDVLLAESLAEAVALALENARLLTETQQRLREQTALRSASMMISSTLDLPTVLNRMAEQMGQAVDVSSAVICDYEPEAMTATVLAEYCGPQASSPERVSDLGNTCDLSQDFQSLVSLFRSGQPGLTHLDNPYLTKAQKARMQQLGVQTMLTIPLQIRGQTVAYAELQESRRHRDFTAEEIALCQGMAQQTAIAMENARLYNEIRQHAAGLSALYGVTRIVNQSLVLEEVLPQALTSALMSLGFEAGVISLFDPATDRLYIAAESGLPSILSAYLQNNEVKGSLSHYVYTHQETLTISDLSQQAPVDVRACFLNQQQRQKTFPEAGLRAKNAVPDR